jgi:cytochrome c556
MSGRGWLAILAGLCASAAGCGEIALREAMTRVQASYVALTGEIEKGSNFKLRDAALELRKALQDPAVTSRSPYAADPRYQRLLREIWDATDKLRRAAQRFDSEAMGSIRAEVSAGCDRCHEAFRKR